MYIDTSLRADGDVVAPVDLEFSNAPVTITSITRSNRTKQDEKRTGWMQPTVSPIQRQV